MKLYLTASCQHPEQGIESSVHEYIDGSGMTYETIETACFLTMYKTVATQETSVKRIVAKYPYNNILMLVP